jgi:hypothetical protein
MVYKTTTSSSTLHVQPDTSAVASCIAAFCIALSGCVQQYCLRYSCSFVHGVLSVIYAAIITIAVGSAAIAQNSKPAMALTAKNLPATPLGYAGSLEQAIQEGRYQDLYYVGIPSSYFNQVYAEQQASQWCWAACIQMILNYYGVSISQYDIVRRSYGRDPYGRLPNWAGSYDIITANLNNWGIDRNGTRYIVRASMGRGMPDPATLVDELANQRPVLLGYATGLWSGHAVVATAVKYSGYADDPFIYSVIVRDPRYNTLVTPYRGRYEYDPSLLRSTAAYWYIRVQRLDGEDRFDGGY